MAEQFLTLMADLDDDTQTRISRWYHDLKEAGFAGTQTLGLLYYISLAKFPLSEERAAIEILQRAAVEFSAVPVHISHIGIFAPGKVLFAAPEINADLAALHRAAAFMRVLAGAGDSVHEVARERLKSHGGHFIKIVFDRYGGLMRTAELKKEGFYYKKIQQLLKDGEIKLVRRGYYQYSGEDSFSDIPAITTLFPDGVICMESALDYYGYTDRTPAAWHLAVDNKSTRTRFYINYPIVKPHFIQSDRYQVGIEEAEIDGKPIKIYDRERTICDLLTPERVQRAYFLRKNIFATGRTGCKA